ncbi:GNAT family N-acetyltransferase [Undibacterium arcticum]|uniref:GNAT family N-acetyltransferase n=1 Tax=Undibacterium arcticum TaxID=1762892 RepID=A0ABV7F2N1_9BURK
MQIEISDDPARLDIALIHRFLTEESTWGRGMPLATLQKAVAHSLCFGAYHDGSQVGFARVISDRATYAYLADVFTLPDYRGRGISRLLMDAVQAHPDLQRLRRFTLVSSTARELYAKYGWTALAKPELHMERHLPDIYLKD